MFSLVISMQHVVVRRHHFLATLHRTTRRKSFMGLRLVRLVIVRRHHILVILHRTTKRKLFAGLRLFSPIRFMLFGTWIDLEIL